MINRWTFLGLGLLIAIVAVVSFACNDDSEGTITTDGAAVTVRIAQPAEGAEVRNPVVLEVQAAGEVEIKEAAAGEADSFHYAAFVDREGAERSASVVRNGEAQGVYQFAGSRVELLDLSPGQHTIVVGLADVDDVMSAVPLARVTFTVEATVAALCQNLVTLEQSIAALSNVTASTQVSDIKAAREAIQNAYDDVVSSANEVQKERLEDLEKANDDLKSAIDDLPDNATLGDAAAAIEGQVAVVRAARDEVSADLDCG